MLSTTILRPLYPLIYDSRTYYITILWTTRNQICHPSSNRFWSLRWSRHHCRLNTCCCAIAEVTGGRGSASATIFLALLFNKGYFLIKIHVAWPIWSMNHFFALGELTNINFCAATSSLVSRQRHIFVSEYFLSHLTTETKLEIPCSPPTTMPG